MKTIRVARIAVFAVIILVLFYFIPKGPVEADSGHRQIMGTFARVVVIAPNTSIAEECIEEAFAQLRIVEKTMSFHDADSELSRVNRLAYSEPVKVSENLFDLLERSVYFSEISGGAFDVTVGPLVDLWRISGDANVPPTPEQIDSALEKIGYQKLLLDSDNMTVQFAQEGMKIDLGGIAKGYAVDKAVKALKFAGAFGGMVDLGGNIRCFGIPTAQRNKWLIGLQDPNVNNLQFGTEKIILTLEIFDKAVATSGDYRRFKVIEGQKHSHIIDTFIGQSSDKLASVTIITEDAIDADALSTAVSVLGEKKGIELIESLEDIEAVLITSAPEYRLILTGGADRYIYEP